MAGCDYSCLSSGWICVGRPGRSGDPVGIPDNQHMDKMTSANQYLEAIAELIEVKATTPQEAAEIVRDKKIKA